MAEQKQCGVIGATFNKMKPYLLVVVLQIGYAGSSILGMLCMKLGLSHYVLVVYRNAVAVIAIAPFALLVERKIRPKLTLSIFLKIAALGLIEPVIDQNLYYVGMRYTSATFTTILYNILPAITFIMAIIFRLEKVKIKSTHGQAQIVGTIFTLGGATIMALYKGPVVDMVWSRGYEHHGTITTTVDHHWVVGTLIIFVGCLCWATFFILQTFTLAQYPAELSLSSLICFTGMVEGAIVALIMERDFSVWAIGFDSRLLAPIYTGIVCSAIAYYLNGIVIKERGPVFATAFSPLCMIIVASLGCLILAEKIHLGSIIGALVIVIGLYLVIWGKSKGLIGSSTTKTTDGKSITLQLPITKTIGKDNADPNNGKVMETIATIIYASQNY